MKKLTRSEKGKGKVSDIQINYSGPSLSHLPDNILVNILLRLTIKRIFVCKCVCKTWYDLISDPDFAKLHFNQGQVYPLLRSLLGTIQSRMLYLVQPEHDDFERKLEMNYDSSPIKIQLDCNLKLPQRNIQKIFDKEMVENKIGMKLQMMNRDYNIVNSCNGLLCLSNLFDNDPVIVCNPVTGELINLPEVITVFTRGNEQNMMAEVHTLGTQNWRVLRALPKSTRMCFPTYLNGCVYWFSEALPYSVTSFDIDKECFESISAPPLDHTEDKVNMGVLRGELFISASQYYNVRFWAMKDNGATKSWSQIFSFDNERFHYGSHQPIKYLNNGEMLVFNSYEKALICIDTRKSRFRYLNVRGFRSEVEAIAHIPSFVPMKHALSGHTVKVLSMKSSCVEFQLHEEWLCISIEETPMDTESDSEDMDQI